MDPVTLSTIAIVTAASSAVVGGVSAYESGQAQRQAGEYQAAVARNNQVLAEQNAQAEEARGRVLEEAKRNETANRQSGIRAAAGASGLDVNTGSPLRLQEDTALLGEQDALTVRNNAMRAAHGFRVQGMNYGAQAQLDMMTAENASRAGALGAWSSIIGGASSVGDKWARFRAAGVSPFGAG